MRHGIGIEDDKAGSVSLLGRDPDGLPVCALGKVGRVIDGHDGCAVALDECEVGARSIGLG